jgi:hypothetical protein
MFIYGSFSEIASSRVWDLERSKSHKKSREEEYADSDFFDFFSIETMYRHLRRIQFHGIAFPYHHHIEGLDDREKCEDITDLRDIMQSEMIEKESTCDKRKCSVLGSRYLDGARERLRSRDFEHIV